MHSPSLSAKYAPRVSRGAEFLDVHERGWHTRVDIETLEFPSVSLCVLGQMHGLYGTGLVELGKDRDWGRDNGFSIDREDNFDWDNWDVLTDLWKAEIQKRLSVAVTV